jgi:hypothetical protein
LTIAEPPNAKPALGWLMPAHDPHAGHEHFNCSCGKVFHSKQELSDHARRLNHKAA